MKRATGVLLVASCVAVLAGRPSSHEFTAAPSGNSRAASSAREGMAAGEMVPRGSALEPVATGAAAKLDEFAGEWTRPSAAAAPVAPVLERERELVAAVIRYFPRAQWQEAINVSECEDTDHDPARRIIDSDGLPRAGVFQIGERWFGPVPADIDGQVAQAAGIVSEHGFAPWACAWEELRWRT